MGTPKTEPSKKRQNGGLYNGEQTNIESVCSSLNMFFGMKAFAIQAIKLSSP